MPGHWAGVLSGLFGTNIWYKVRKSQVLGDQYSEYEFFESDITPSQNINAVINEQNNRSRKKMKLLSRPEYCLKSLKRFHLPSFQ